MSSIKKQESPVATLEKNSPMPEEKCSTAECTKGAIKGVLGRVKDFIMNKPLVVITGLIATILVGLLVAWIVYTVVQKKVLENKSYLLEESKMPLSGLVLNRCDGSKIPDTANGKRFAFSFWIYIHNLDKNTGLMRHVLHRGDEKNAVGGSPTVFLDSSINKLYISFDTTSKNSGDPTNMTTIEEQVKYSAAKRGIIVDYVPLQRWVHIGVVVNEDANGGSISSYIDGELVKTATSSKTSTVTIGSETLTVSPNINSLALDRHGNVFVGGTNDAASGVGFSGLVSMIEFYNYNLNAKDMYEIYSRGPLHVTALGKLANGLGIGTVTNQYGLRNPIYKKPVITM